MVQRQLLKTLNRVSILNVIKAQGPIARTDIANLTGLSPATVTSLTAELMTEGLIFEKQEGDSRGGRRPILLALDAEGAYVVGIKLAEEHATLVLTNLNAEIVVRNTVGLLSRDPVHVSDQVADEVRVLLQSAHVDRERLLGVGMGLAGIIDASAGTCRMSPFNDWHDVPFATLIQDRLGYPVYLDNDVNTLTLMEQLYGIGQRIKDFLVVTVGRGIGMGMVVDGHIYRGATGGAGEFGHTVIDPEGPRCACGNRGCLETFVAEPWLLQWVRLNGIEIDTPDALVEAAKGGERLAIEAFARAGRILGRSVANLINLFNPAMIIVSGEGVRAGDFMFEPMRQEIANCSFGQLAEGVELRIEPLEDDAWAHGAASLALQNLFRAPDLLLQGNAE